jgi:hypothetical protein
MQFGRAFIRNLSLMVLIFGGMVIFAAIFYPETLSVFYAMGQVYSGLNLWPIIILMLIITAIPRRKR